MSDPAPISTSAHDPLTELADAEATDEPPADGDASVLILGDGTSVVLQTDQGPANMQQQQVQAQTLAQQLQPFTSFQVEFERVQVGAGEGAGRSLYCRHHVVARAPGNWFHACRLRQHDPGDSFRVVT